jgi:hypothetical protein
MTTLNDLQCTSADVTVAKGGAMWARLTLADATASPALDSRATLAIAGIDFACTITDTGTPRGGIYSVEVTGGAGGWAKPAPTAEGYRNDAGQRLSEVAAKLGEAVGETVSLATGVDRSLGVLVAVAGGSDAPSAGAVLSQLCALPEGQAKILWWVDPSGVTRLGPRLPLGEIEATEVDADDRRAWVAFAEDDASGMLPGATIGGVEVVELRIEARPGKIREVCTLASTSPAGQQTVAVRMLRWCLDIVRPLVIWRGIYTYRVTKRSGDRFDASPASSRVAPELGGVRFWSGAAGHSAEAKVGARCLIAFPDGNPNAAVILGWLPRDSDKGKPDKVVFDASEVLIGPTATRGIARIDDTVVVLFPPATFTGTIGGATAAGMVVWAGQGMGTISTASAKGKSE